MPILSKDNKKVLFIHIPKCAGTSITETFESNGWQVDWMNYPARDNVPDILPCNPQHYHIPLIEKYIDVNIDVEFTITRHPWKKLISEYFWSEPGIARHTKEFDDNFYYNFEPYMVARMSEYVVAENYFTVKPEVFYKREIRFPFDNHMRPQVDFIRESTKVFDLSKFSKIEKFLHSEFNIKGIKETNKSKNELSLPLTTEYNFSDRFKDLYMTLYEEDHKKLDYELPFKE